MLLGNSLDQSCRKIFLKEDWVSSCIFSKLCGSRSWIVKHSYHAPNDMSFWRKFWASRLILNAIDHHHHHRHLTFYIFCCFLKIEKMEDVKLSRILHQQRLYQQQIQNSISTEASSPHPNHPSQPPTPNQPTRVTNTMTSPGIQGYCVVCVQWILNLQIHYYLQCVM